jgi:hypothetical protein
MLTTLTNGIFHHVIGQQFTPEDIAEAHTMQESGRAIGNLNPRDLALGRQESQKTFFRYISLNLLSSTCDSNSKSVLRKPKGGLGTVSPRGGTPLPPLSHKSLGLLYHKFSFQS